MRNTCRDGTPVAGCGEFHADAYPIRNDSYPYSR
jgi:hypothetical protein